MQTGNPLHTELCFQRPSRNSPYSYYTRHPTVHSNRQNTTLMNRTKKSKLCSKKSADNSVDCDGCNSVIVEDEHEALQCEGVCQKWYHRLCAGVSKFHYDHLADSPDPFICWLCTDSLRKTAIESLRQELATLKADFSSEIESNRVELAALKE